MELLNADQFPIELINNIDKYFGKHIKYDKVLDDLGSLKDMYNFSEFIDYRGINIYPRTELSFKYIPRDSYLLKWDENNFSKSVMKQVDTYCPLEKPLDECLSYTFKKNLLYKLFTYKDAIRLNSVMLENGNFGSHNVSPMIRKLRKNNRNKFLDIVKFLDYPLPNYLYTCDVFKLKSIE